MKLFISPNFRGVDKGADGGIRRIVDRQRAYFKSSLVDSVQEADTVAMHAGSIVKVNGTQKVISHCHGLYWSKYTNWNQPANEINNLIFKAIKLSDFITAPTEWVSNSLRRSTNREVTTIGHGVDPDWIPGDINKGYVLWNKSRVDRVCDPDPVYKVAALLPDIDFRLTVGRQHDNLKNITITGLTPYSDKTPVQEAGVYLATAQETFGIGILEALACGVPVVGWNWGGAADILPKEWLAAEGDIDKLSQLIKWALLNHDNLKDQCMEIAAKYTWDAAMESYEELYSRELPHKRISVIIRNYNTADLLGECIESVMGQVTDDDEVIVVDDSSTDNSEEVARQYKVKWLKTPENLHLARALDYGVSHSNGRYIIPIDSDNMITPRTLKLLSDALDKDRDIDIAYGRIKWLTPNGRPMRTTWPPNKFNLEQQLNHKNQIPCTAMYRRKVYEACGPYRARCRVAEDADFWCRAGILGFNVSQVTEAETLVYRVRQGTTSQVERDWPWESWYVRPDNKAHSCEPVLVSIIIPVGPGHEYLLQDALDSVYAQSFKNWECIVINDTGKNFDYALPPWVKLITTEGGIGPSKSRNLGLDEAKGVLFVPLDADDYLTYTALENMIRLWSSNKHNYVYGDYLKEAGVHKTPDMSCDRMKQQMPHILTGLYPILSDVRFADDVGIGEDWDFALQMQRAGFCGIRLPKPICRYRVESGLRRKAFTNADRQIILDKWEDVEMAGGCSTCAQRAAAMRRELASATSNISNEDLVLVEYIGRDSKRYYDGVRSGRTYSFGNSPGLKEKWVLKIDESGFLNRPDKFIVHSSNTLSSGNVESNTPAFV